MRDWISWAGDYHDGDKPFHSRGNLLHVTYSRSNPSPRPRFTELVQIYQQLHQDGDILNNLPPEKTFSGRSLAAHLDPLKTAVDAYQLRTILDYGCGKALAHKSVQYTTPEGKTLHGLREVLGVDEITLYDPGFGPYQELPKGTFDGVVCCDVLEHIPEEDTDWVIDELFAYAETFLLCTVACYPASKNLPDGENAHVTLKKPGWWIDKIEAAAARRGKVKYFAWVETDTDQRHLIVQG